MPVTGRPTKLTPKVKEKILNAVRVGMVYERAALAAGISEATFYSWKVRGKDGESPYLEFLEELKEAEAEGEADDLNVIHDAGFENWTARAWKLERRHPERYTKKERIEHTGDGLQISITLKEDE